MTAELLLAALRADGCTVATEGGRLAIDGTYTDAQRAEIIALKLELIALLVAEQRQTPAEPVVDPVATPPAEVEPTESFESILLRHYPAARARPLVDPDCPVLVDGDEFWRRMNLR